MIIDWGVPFQVQMTKPMEVAEQIAITYHTLGELERKLRDILETVPGLTVLEPWVRFGQVNMYLPRTGYEFKGNCQCSCGYPAREWERDHVRYIECSFCGLRAKMSKPAELIEQTFAMRIG